MLLKKTNNILIILFIFFFLLTRLPRLNNDVINPDGVNWHYRAQQFVNGLKYFQFEKTYQHYHPGVTLMWVTGLPIELTKIITGQKVYNHLNFEMFDFVAKASLVTVQLFLTLLTIYLLSKIFDFKKSLIIVSLFTFEPFFVGNSRLYHLDLLLTLFVFNALLLFYIYFIKPDLIKNKFLGVIVGLFIALSFLTKSIGIGLYVYILGFSLFSYFIERDTKKLKKLLTITLSFVAFTFLLFPALWVRPIYYLNEIFSEGERVGVRKGHEQILFGETTTDAGPLFYPMVLLIKYSPFILLGLLSSLSIFIKSFKTSKFKLKEKLKSINWLLGIFYLGYFVVMTFPTKKVDRYMVLLFPLIAYYAFLGYEELIIVYKSKIKNLVILSFGFFVLYPLLTFFPYYFTYYSPLFLSAQNAHAILAQKPFGVGMHDLKQFILDNYGEVRLGFIDVKPMESIYPASKVLDIRNAKKSDYDVIILGPNEEIPTELRKSTNPFVLDKSMYINGLEYWRVYVKTVKE